MTLSPLSSLRGLVGHAESLRVLFAVLLNRHAKLKRAGMLALEHAVSVSVQTAGPPYAEMMLLKLEALSNERGIHADEMVREV